MTADSARTDALRPADAPLVRVRGLRTRLGSTQVFDGVDLDVPRGGVVAIMGPSGTGKTTLLRHLTGQLRHDHGEVQVFGQDLARLRPQALYALRRRMGMLFQHGALLTDLDVFDNVAFPLRENTDLPESLIRVVVLLKLQAVGLRGAAGLMPAQLSGGMARRVALARAIALDPELVLYDEPFVGLDPIAVAAVVELMRTLNQTLGLTSIVVAHEIEHLRKVADRLVVLSGGRVVAQGRFEDVLASESPMVRQFLQGLSDGPVPFHYPAPSLGADFGLETHR
ncbi:MAG: ABC transporter ATP-binding protein [Xanthomonadales bacterium]|nr:ABC transporter ATP-binding protein [Xanthomonadales bacterium]